MSDQAWGIFLPNVNQWLVDRNGLIFWTTSHACAVEQLKQFRNQDAIVKTFDNCEVNDLLIPIDEKLQTISDLADELELLSVQHAKLAAKLCKFCFDQPEIRRVLSLGNQELPLTSILKDLRLVYAKTESTLQSIRLQHKSAGTESHQTQPIGESLQ